MLTHAVDVVVFAVAVDTRDKQTTSQFPDFRFGLRAPFKVSFPSWGCCFQGKYLIPIRGVCKMVLGRPFQCHFD